MFPTNNKNTTYLQLAVLQRELVSELLGDNKEQKVMN